MTVALGVDLSARAAAAVAVPADWDGQWSRVTSMVYGEQLPRNATDAERARRCETIATRIVTFARATGATSAWIESYAFSTAHGAHTLAEIGGVVRLELVRAGIEVRTAQQATARKLLLGKVPRADVKVAVYTALRAAGARFETFDECDAFTCANYALSEELGGYCFCQLAS